MVQGGGPSGSDVPPVRLRCVSQTPGATGQPPPVRRQVSRAGVLSLTAPPRRKDRGRGSALLRREPLPSRRPQWSSLGAAPLPRLRGCLAMRDFPMPAGKELTFRTVAAETTFHTRTGDDQACPWDRAGARPVDVCATRGAGDPVATGARHHQGVAGRSWIEELREESESAAFPPCGDDGIEVRDLAVGGAMFTLDEVAEKPELVNVRLRDCDIAGFVARGGRADRLLIEAGRLRGVTWASGLLRDIELRDVVGSELCLRFSTLRRVIFRDCQLPGVDLTEAVLDDVRFERCLLRGAQLHRMQVKSLRIEGCDLSGASGVEALAGASIHPDDVLVLAPSMALALGLKLESDRSN